MAKAKLRKMLGSAEHPIVLEIKDIIDTQSKETLAAWAAAYAEEVFLPIYMKHCDDAKAPDTDALGSAEPCGCASCADENPLQAALAGVRACLAGEIKLKDLKPLVKEAQAFARDTVQPTAQAAARAVATAVGVLQTPTNSLGLTFYGAAAVAYDSLGLEAPAAAYDAAADEEFLRMRESLKACSVENELKPVKLKWNC